MFFQRYKFASYTEKRVWRLTMSRICLCVLFVFIIYQLISAYLIIAYRIQSDTMQPAFSAGDMVIAIPFYSVNADIERGALVAVEPVKKPEQHIIKMLVQRLVAFFTFQLIDPFSSHDPSHAKPFIRRVVGIPGDTVYMENFILHIKTKENGHFLTEFEVARNDYNVKLESLPENWDPSLPFSGTYPKTTLKEGEYFVLCDNRIASNDSRLWGPVFAGKQIKHHILARYWPLTRFSLF